MSEAHVSPILEAAIAAGGVVRDYHGRTLLRHFSDPHGEYEAAVEGAAVFDPRREWPTSPRASGTMIRPATSGAASACPSSATAPGERVNSACPSWRRFCVTLSR